MQKPICTHSLLSDVTPWWWTRNAKAKHRAVLSLLKTKKFDITRLDITSDKLFVQLALDTRDDLNRTQERVDALRTVLDEMVAT